ncbi:hypothetical protein, partial [Comamonas thiooxydans]|uniref:hypothetical protein n=1 Tax=Comamonas thiooxydans TaxID=363952 RepID=UPI0019D6D958
KYNKPLHANAAAFSFLHRAFEPRTPGARHWRKLPPPRLPHSKSCEPRKIAQALEHSAGNLHKKVPQLAWQPL